MPSPARITCGAEHFLNFIIIPLKYAQLNTLNVYYYNYRSFIIGPIYLNTKYIFECIRIYIHIIRRTVKVVPWQGRIQRFQAATPFWGCSIYKIYIFLWHPGGGGVHPIRPSLVWEKSYPGRLVYLGGCQGATGRRAISPTFTSLHCWHALPCGSYSPNILIPPC